MKLIQKSFRACLLLVLGLCLFSSCKDEYQERYEDQQNADEQIIQKYLKDNNITDYQRQPSGVYYLPQTPGNGARVQANSMVEMHYIGRLVGYTNTPKFESTYENGQTKRVRIGAQHVVRGLEEGLQLMQQDEKASVIIPSGLAYGRYGNYGSIPPNAILLYEIHLLKVE